MKLINRLIDPDTGSVVIDGRPIVGCDAPELRRRIGYVFQGGGLFPHMTVAENIGITPQLLGWRSAEIASRTAELLDLVALPRALGSRFPAALSGGQQQRVAVARALAAKPAIVLLDEPFGALDPVTRDTLGTAYRAIHDQFGLTTIMVTHDMLEATLLADRIIVLKAGRITADVVPAGLLAPQVDPNLAALVSVPLRQSERFRILVNASAGPSCT